MKKIKALSCLAIIGAIAFFGCTKSKSNTSTSSGMSATIGSTAFIGDSCWWSKDLVDTTNVTIFAPDNSGTYTSIEIFLNGYHGTGTYTFSSSGANICYASVEGTGPAFGMSTSGTVTITGTSPNVVGTFNFTVSGVAVSSGNFSAFSY